MSRYYCDACERIHNRKYDGYNLRGAKQYCDVMAPVDAEDEFVPQASEAERFQAGAA